MKVCSINTVFAKGFNLSLIKPQNPAAKFRNTEAGEWVELHMSLQAAESRLAETPQDQ
jgi:hypothetical protein